MASVQQNLSVFDKSNLPDAAKMRFGIVVAEWNAKITEALFNYSPVVSTPETFIALMFPALLN
jgi:hypothetical protein